MGERLWRQRIGALVCALALLGAGGASSASARVFQAQSILPPGQSGFVSLSGVASGTGSPHLYDQTQPFIDFRWKNAVGFAVLIIVLVLRPQGIFGRARTI